MSTSKHPKGLYLIFATSTAERFSYYGMRAIFILFLTQALLFDKEHAAFMVFVIMSAAALLILFLLSKKLQKMMHGVE